MSFQQQDLASYPSSLVLGGSKSSVCRCQNTKCLKLYCACFRDSKICGDSCKCVSCANTTDESGINGRLTLARQELLKKKPNAFGDRTCRCTKARCLRKYCVCFSAGVSCTDACKCVSCANPKGTRVSLPDVSETVSTVAHVAAASEGAATAKAEVL